MGQKMRRCAVILIGMAVAVGGWAQAKSVKQQLSNNAMAIAGEIMYQAGADSILSDKKITMGHATFRYLLKSSDRSSREWQANFQNRMVYRMLVRQCEGFLEDYNAMMTAARKHPEHMPGCITAGTELLLQAYSFVKHAVVVAMNSQVPLPWKVDYDEFLEGKDRTPKYKDDPDKEKEDVDKHNLLLPSERFDILNNTLVQLINMRMALRAVTSRLNVDFTWQKAVEYAVNFRSYIHEAQGRAYTTFCADIAQRPLP